MRIRIIVPLIFILLVCFNATLNAAMFANESCHGFSGEQCTTGGGDRKANPTIGQLVIESGTYFLKSNSDMLLFLSMIESSEASEPGFKTLQEVINSAIDNMENAKTACYRLKNLAAITPYNQEVISRLIVFNYTNFQNEKGLIPVIFEKVINFLKNGNVRGIYNEFYNNFNDILDVLYDLKKDVDNSNFPELSTMWRINQKYTEVKLFGQYVAEVFYSIE